MKTMSYQSFFGIDHRVERPIVLGQPDRIERFSARFDADRFPDFVRPQPVERHREYEGLRDRLNREGSVAVAGRIDLAVHRGEADAEEGGIRLAEFGDVVGDGAAKIVCMVAVAGIEEPLNGKGICRRQAGAEGRRSCWERQVISSPHVRFARN